MEALVESDSGHINVGASVSNIGYVFSVFACSFTSLSITHQPSSSDHLRTFVSITLTVVVDINPSILDNVLKPLSGSLGKLGISL